MWNSSVNHKDGRTGTTVGTTVGFIRSRENKKEGLVEEETREV